MTSHAVSYVLPLLRQRDDPGLEELSDYLAHLSERVEVIVADGSDPDVFAFHAGRWDGRVRHVRVDRTVSANGKVAGVHAGIAAASRERIIVADDDVRFTPAELAGVATALDSADLVRPQNYFDPLPWHAAWDSARILLNRCWGADSPGTLGVRRSFFVAIGGYDGGVLYENLELIRTVAAAGGRVANCPGLYVRRVPPSTRRFWEQRPRQAYDDLCQPMKLAAMLAVLPGLTAMSRTERTRRVVILVSLTAVAMAEIGRRRHDGGRVFPPVTSWFAPVWILERGVCAWLAVAYRLTGGVPYAGARFRVAAHSLRELRRRVGRTDPVTAVAERRGLGAAAAT